MDRTFKDLLIETLSIPTYLLLALGGDDRLTLDLNSKVNKYGSSTQPLPDIYRRSSCTSSTIDIDAYNVAESLQLELYDKVEATKKDGNELVSLLNDYYENTRHRLKTILFEEHVSLETVDHEIVLFPSGSDAEYLPLVLALIRSSELTFNSKMKRINPKVINIVTCINEVGSGTSNACGGKHFSELSPRGQKLEVNSNLEGLISHSVETVLFKARNSITGEFNEDEQEIIEDIRRRLSSLNDEAVSVAVLHVVLGTKTGVIFPSFDSVANLCAEFGARIVVVVDACQFRCAIPFVRTLTERGYLTLITGSKYFGAPPFCGAVVIPGKLVSELENYFRLNAFNPSHQIVPIGLGHYLQTYDAPSSMVYFRNFLDAAKNHLNSLAKVSSPGSATSLGLECNLGLLLRWHCALHTMEAYQRLCRYTFANTPDAVVTTTGQDASPVVSLFIAEWLAGVRALIKQRAPFLSLLDSPTNNDFINLGNHSTIVSFTLSCPTGGVASRTLHSMDMEECKILFGLMMVPITTDWWQRRFDATRSALYGPHDDPQFAADLASGVGDLKVLLGQPVKLTDDCRAVLRIALGAETIVKTLSAYLSPDPRAAQVTPQMVRAIVNRVLVDDRLIIDKISFLVKNWTRFSTKASAQNAPGVSVTLLEKFAAFDAIFGPPSHLSASATGALTLSSIASVAQSLVRSNQLDSTTILYDIDALRCAFYSVTHAFQESMKGGADFLHCIAMKSCPLVSIIHCAVTSGLGVEAASFAEVVNAIRCGCSPSKVVFDSCSKTRYELEEALSMGVTINVNSLNELDKIAEVLKQREAQGHRSASRVGLRVNPLVGEGTIPELSTACEGSKFGITLTSIEASELFRKHSFLSGLMVHVGSQGMALETMVEGVRRLCMVAEDIEQQCPGRIEYIDIGGGLSANYDSDEISPTFQSYTHLLQRTCPVLFSRKWTVITEFGKSLIAKTGAIVTKVEDVLPGNLGTVDTSLIVHCGADLLLRTCYVPRNFSHRVALLDRNGKAKTDDVLLRTAVHGPLCFSGDVLTRDAMLPRAQVGDCIVLLDAGANTLSLFSKHCSRKSPSVIAFRQGISELKICKIREEETIDSVLQFWI